MTTSRLFSGALMLALALAPGAALAEDARYPGLERYVGLFRNAGGEVEEQARLDAIEASVASQTRVLRGVTRRRLLSGTHVTSTYEIQVDGELITIGIDDGRQWTTDLQGTPAQYEHDGEAMTMSRVWVEGEIHATGEQRVGTGQYHFHLSEDRQTLTVEFTMSSKLLPDPVRFTTTYRRQ
ncbi:MAG: hypothetical protein QGH45_15900 [Myxococcota bacterium]|nr:hypothetical protein [Myxococcota bacterium]